MFVYYLQNLPGNKNNLFRAISGHEKNAEAKIS